MSQSYLFLYLSVKLLQAKIETDLDLHIKPTDRHQYLHYS